MSTITVLFYSNHSKHSLQLYDIIQQNNFLNINCIHIDNPSIRNRLKKNGITEVPVLFFMENNGDITTLVGKDCFLYIQNIVDEMLKLKEQQKEKESKKTTPLNISKFDKNSGMSDILQVSQSKVGRNVGTQQAMSERQIQDLNIKPDEYDDTKRTIKNEDESFKPPHQKSMSTSFQVASNPSHVQQPQQTILDDDDFISEPPPSIPSPIASTKTINDKSLDDDPSGMGLPKGGGGSPVAIANMLENSRGEVKIAKAQ